MGFDFYVGKIGGVQLKEQDVKEDTWKENDKLGACLQHDHSWRACIVGQNLRTWEVGAQFNKYVGVLMVLM